MEREKTRFFIFDDHPVIRFSVEALIKENFSSVEIRFPNSGVDLLNQIQVNVLAYVILDLNIPGEDTFYLTENILKKNPLVRILVFSSNPEELYAIRFLKVGVFGYLHKSASSAEIVSALQTIYNGKKYLGEKVSNQITRQIGEKELRNPFDLLSPRELTVLQLILQGKGNVEIAKELFLQPSTVGTHKLRIFEKLKVKNELMLFELYKLYFKQN